MGIDYGPLIDSMTWSASRIKSFEQCPYGWFLHYILFPDEPGKEKFYTSYGIWRHMMERCYDAGDRYYPRYGGRGIGVYDGWKDYHAFKSWAFANGYTESLTIDRLDNNGDYEPDNCEWVDAKTQANNTSRNHLLTYMGVTRTMAEWADEFGINYNTLNVRIHRGWSVERALTEPKRGRYVK